MTFPNALHLPADGPAVYLPMIQRGTSWVRTMSVYDASGNPVDLRGHDARMYFRERAGGNLYLQLANGSGITLGNGTLSWSLTAAQTLVGNIPISRPTFELEMRWANGTIDPVFGGTAAMLP